MRKEIITCVFFLGVIQLKAQINEELVIEEESRQIEYVFRDSLRQEKPVINKYTLGNGVTFTSHDGNHSLNFTGYMQASIQTHWYDGTGDMHTRWRLRRARFRMNGVSNQQKIIYRIGTDFVTSNDGGDISDRILLDAWIRYRPWSNNKLYFTFGQRSSMTDNKENFTSSQVMQFSERSRLSSFFGTVREVGLHVQSTQKIGKMSYIKPTLVITDGDGRFSLGQRYGGLKYGGRLDYLPFGLFRAGGEFYLDDFVYELAPKLNIGTAYSYNAGTSDRRGGRSSGDILYLDDKGAITLPDFARLNVDFLFKFRGFSALGEYTKTWAYIPNSITTRVRNDGTTTDNFQIDGVQDINNYIRNRMILGSAYNIQAGYLFRSFWSVNTRYTNIRPDGYSYLNNNLYFNRNQVFEISAAKYLTKNFASKIQFTAGLMKTNGITRYTNGEFKGYEGTFNILTQISF
ncbi:MAG: porin [Capnocytophaga sp.]|nr:porin [Capnocytophaga sp.]